MFEPTFKLARNPFGRLVLTDATGRSHEGVSPIRSFPIAAPAEGISLVAINGEELAWIPDLGDLPSEMKLLVEQELAGREFMPTIIRLKHVSSFATPSTWWVDTDRGETTFVLRGEEDIRHLGKSSLLIADSHSIQFLIADLMALDKTSRRLLDRFL
ncbi:MAG: DUF1854 domain-containing protein [Rhodocyclaceae bacterium]|jgi:hypothetical protein|nr:DUF1854 domain-containing protein [Rhodocyclaceae bacterium]